MFTGWQEKRGQEYGKKDGGSHVLNTELLVTS